MACCLPSSYLVGDGERDRNDWIVLGVSLSSVRRALQRLQIRCGRSCWIRKITLWSVGLKFSGNTSNSSRFRVYMSPERSSAVPTRCSFANCLHRVGCFGRPCRHGPSASQACAFSCPLLAWQCSFSGLLPYCGFVYIYQGMAERFAYLPAPSDSCWPLSPRGYARQAIWRGECCWVVSQLWAVMGEAWRLATRVEDWREPIALFRNSLTAAPRSAYLERDLGGCLRRSGRIPAGSSRSTRKSLVQFAPRRSDDNPELCRRSSGRRATGHQAETQYRRVMDTPAARQQSLCGPGELVHQRKVGSMRPLPCTSWRLRSIPTTPAAYFDLGVMFLAKAGAGPRSPWHFYRKVLQLKPGDPLT